MRRRIVLLIIFVLVLGGVVFFFGRVFNRGPKQGVLKIQSTPQATVYLDNKNIGRTPFEEKVDVAEYTVRVVPDSTVANLASWQGKITVGQNLLTFINRDLTESELTNAGEVLWLEKVSNKQSEVSITTSPDGAAIQIDDQQKAVSPKLFDAISPGDHVITIASPGFATRTLRIKTTAGYKLNAAVQLALAPASTSPVDPALNATPAVVEATPFPSMSITPVPSVKVSATPTPSAKTSPTPTSKVGASPSPVADPARPFVTIKETPTGFLRVRESASTSSKEVGRVNPGQKFTIIEEEVVGGVTWYKISYDETGQGWVSGQYAVKTQ